MIDLRSSRFTDIMPENLASQLETQAFAYALGRQIEKLCTYADTVRVYAEVDTMPEKILDVLAIELQTPAYNQQFSIEVKRKLVKGTLYFYSKLGTPAAVNWAVRTIFGSGKMDDWYNYGGKPHHFKIHIGNGGNMATIERLNDFLRIIASIKRLSSWLDEITQESTPMHTTLHYGGASSSYSRTVLSEWRMDQSFTSTINIAGVFAVRSRTGLPPVE